MHPDPYAGLDGPAKPIRVEPVELPEPAREPAREEPAEAPPPAPVEPVEEPVPA